MKLVCCAHRASLGLICSTAFSLLALAEFLPAEETGVSNSRSSLSQRAVFQSSVIQSSDVQSSDIPTSDIPTSDIPTPGIQSSDSDAIETDSVVSSSDALSPDDAKASDSKSAAEVRRHVVTVGRGVDDTSTVDPIGVTCDWGLHDQLLLRVRLTNRSKTLWQQVEATSSCSCVDLKIGKIQSTEDQEQVVRMDAWFRRPSAPGISPQTVRMNLDERVVSLPVLIDWLAPLSLSNVVQVNPQLWHVSGVVRPGWQIKSIVCQRPQLTLSDIAASDGQFSLKLTGHVQGRCLCRLECATIAARSEQTQRQTLDLVLESSQPRSVPSRIVGYLTDRGTVQGHTRVVFPAARYGARPTLISAELRHRLGDEQEQANDPPVTLSTDVTPIGRVAIKIEFESNQVLDVTKRRETYYVRFLFNDGSHVDCPLLIS